MAFRLYIFLRCMLIVGVLFIGSHLAEAGVFVDPTFGNDGKVSTPASPVSDIANDAALQSDGKIVLAGSGDVSGDTNFILVRHNVDGSLDSTFGGTGIVNTDFSGPAGYDNAQDVAIQPNGKIVAAGWSFDGVSSDRFVLARYNSDGTLDLTFDGDGKVITPQGFQIWGMAIQTDGKIVVGGYGPGSGANDSADFAVARYNTNGSLDLTFGGTGIVYYDLFPLQTSADVAWALALQPDGKIILGGQVQIYPSTASDIALARFNSDGSVDTSFATNGQVIFDLGGDDESIREVLVTSIGKVVVAGTATSGTGGFIFDTFVGRLDSLGGLDPTFGTGGFTQVPDSNSNALCQAAVLQADGSIITAGFYETMSGSDAIGDFGSYRLLSDGSLDPDYGDNGLFTVDFSGKDDQANAIFLQPDGKIVIAGGAGSDSTSDDFGFARLVPSTLLLYDAFNGTEFSPWAVLSGVWTIQGGSLQLSSNKGRILSPSSFAGCGECTFEADVQFGQSKSGAALRAWYQNSSNYVELTVNNQKNNIVLKEHVNGTVVSSRAVKYTLQDGVIYHVGIRYDGSNLRVFLNGIGIMNLLSSNQWFGILELDGKTSNSIPLKFPSVLIYEPVHLDSGDH